MPASKKEAKEFVKRWQKRLAAIPAGSNNEQQDTQKFWVDLSSTSWASRPTP